MKKGSYLVNTSRGSVIDEKYLGKYLVNGHLAGAALDVFEKEPYNGIFQKMENVILTPHMGASDKEARYMMELESVNNCTKLLENKKINNLVY